MIMRKEYIIPDVKERSLRTERYFLASEFTTPQNESIEENDYEW
jgi:hypothetical protein